MGEIEAGATVKGADDDEEDVEETDEGWCIGSIENEMGMGGGNIDSEPEG